MSRGFDSRREQLNCSEHDVSPDPDSAALAAGQRIGVAFARSLGDGTTPVQWRRLPSPILSVRTASWDSIRVCNPAALVLPNGTVLLAYRAIGRGASGLGIASAPHWAGPYTALLDAPLFGGRYAEDPALFLSPSGIIHLIAHGEMSLANGSRPVGVHAASADGVNWGEPTYP